MAEERVMIEMEYLLNTTPGILFNRLSTASGLSEWFANDVGVEGKVYSFKWEGITQRAEQTLRKENKLVRFNWLDEDLEGAWFEFRINVDELTGDVALHVVDHVEEDEQEDSIELWNRQIEILKHGLGSL
jgi:uncharacterized protein YndB with AHSA1/START domain